MASPFPAPPPRPWPRRSRRRRYTPEEFLDIEAEDGIAYELDNDGRLVERKLGALSSVIAGQIAYELRKQAGPAAYVFGGGAGLHIFPDRPRRIVRANVVYLSRTATSAAGGSAP